MIEETHEIRLKRLKIRSWHRGMKEMDLILGHYFDANAAQMDSDQLDIYEALLVEDDHDLYGWVSGREAAPAKFSVLIKKLKQNNSLLHILLYNSTFF